MKLMDFVNQLQRTAGDPSGDEHLVGTVLQYINEEVDYVSREFPEQHTITWITTASQSYHLIDFSNGPTIRIDEVMVDGVGAEKRRWKELRGSIGNVV